MDEYTSATTEFLAYNLSQRIRHATPQAPSQPSRRPDVLESAAQHDEIIRGITEAGSSSSAPPAPQTDPALIAILERMQQDQTRQA